MWKVIEMDRYANSILSSSVCLGPAKQKTGKNGTELLDSVLLR
jgi:hypothetical protein